MFNPKREVDLQVNRILSKTKNLLDETREGLRIARLYFEIKEYEEANSYLANYLGEFTLDPHAWKLKGEICEVYEKNWSNALKFYIQCFKLNDTDLKVLLKICKCYLKIDDSEIDIKTARMWLEKAEQYFPSEKFTIDLKEKILRLFEESESDEWHLFLIKALSKNFSDETLHLKFIKLCFRRQTYKEAFIHFIRLENKSVFSSSDTWFKSLTELVESNLSPNLVLNSLFTILITIYRLLNNLDEDESIVLKLNNQLRILDDLKINPIISNELKAQFFFVCALLFNKKGELNMSNVLMAKSAQISKPSSKCRSLMLNVSLFELGDLKLSNELLKLIMRDMTWRYSVIGNWFKYTTSKYYDHDSIHFVIKLKELSESLNINKELESQLGINDCFETNFQFDANVIELIDQQTLEFSDKYTLASQEANLKYLVWFNLTNLKQSLNPNELKETISYKSFYHMGSHLRPDVRFGVENLNICNLDSLCLLDMKIFLYLTTFQAISNLKPAGSSNIRPFWLQTNLCNDMQQDWWQNCWNYLFKSTIQKVKKIDSLESIDCLNEQYFCTTELDSKKQNDLAKILELVRLKSQTVKLENERFKLDINLCLNVARNLQFLVENWEKPTSQEQTNINLSKHSPTKSNDDASKMISVINLELKYSPKEKLVYLKRYALAYWEFIAKQLIKMKQLNAFETDSFEKSQQRLSIDSTHPKVGQSLYKNYFNYIASEWQEDKENHTGKKPNELFYQNIIQMGILYSILSQVDVENEDKDLSSALSNFQLLDENVKDRNMNNLMFNKLDICKQIAEHLIKSRDHIEFIRLHSPKKIGRERLSETIAQVQLLIECIKKEISLSFKKNLNMPQLTKEDEEQYALNELNTSLNKSISDSIREIENLAMESVHRKKLIEEQEKQLTELQIKENEEKTRNKLIEDELKNKNEEIERLQQKIELKIQQEDEAAKQVQEEADKRNQQRVVHLIETLTKQRSEHLKINMDILKDQFIFLNSQFRQIKNEILSLHKSSSKRQDILKEFRKIVNDFNQTCDQTMFNAQFNVLFWLFQQQLDINPFLFTQLEHMAKQSTNNHQNNITANVETTPKKKQNLNTTYNTSINEYLTPDSKQISMSYLSKPIGEIQFPVGKDIREELLHSVDCYVQNISNYQDEEEKQEEECDEYEDYDYEDAYEE